MKDMTPYIDGFLLSVPKANLEKYKELAELGATVWKDHGALEYRECVGDDLEVENLVSFPKMAGAKQDEVVIFACAVFESREARDEANQKIMADPRLVETMKDAPGIFDCKRMACGGFKTLLYQ